MDLKQLTTDQPELVGWTMPGLEDRTIVITGAASGIGAAAARALVAAGARVLLVDRDADGLATTVAELPGERAVVCVADLAEPTAPERIVAAALDAFGALTTVVHIAGVVVQNTIDDVTRAEVDLQMHVNLEAPFWLSQAALPHLRGGGQIVLCGSTSSYVGTATGVVYCATKAGVLGMMRAMAVELAPQGIRVNAISPGTTKTPINEPIFAVPGFLERAVKANPDGRIAEAHEHVGAIAYLVSDLAKHVHGQDIVIDGGHIAQ